eukprot:5910164-Alexandrium_andersonii.AAC.1
MGIPSADCSSRHRTPRSGRCPPFRIPSLLPPANPGPRRGQAWCGLGGASVHSPPRLGRPRAKVGGDQRRA